MEYLNEAVALGIDAIILGFCLNEFFDNRRHIQNIKTAQTLKIDGDLKDYVAGQREQKISYAIIRGTVQPMGEPLRNTKLPEVASVLHVQKLREHRFTRGFAGFWSERSKLLHISVASIPFELSSNGNGVEIVNAMSAQVLDLQLISDNYQPTNLSLWDHLFGFIMGVRQKCYQTTEEVLRNGTLITAVGELRVDNGKMYMGTSSEGALFLTTSTKAGLLQRLKEAQNSTVFKIVCSTTVAAIFTTLIVRKFLARRKLAKDARELKDSLEAAKRAGRIQARNDTQEKCVVCMHNPKEIICLPCGHVCMCIECSELTKTTCPICRATIQTRAAAFIT